MSVFSNENFIRTLDVFFSKEDTVGAGRFLKEQYALCLAEKNTGGRLTVLNELVGYYRQTGEKDDALKAIGEALELIPICGIDNETSGATVYLNCATTLKCFGKSEEAIGYYDKAENIYRKTLDEYHPLMAGLFNNKALALQDSGRIDEAEKLFRKAIEITLTDKRNSLETAVSYINLAHLLFDKNPLDGEINSLIDMTYDILMNPLYFGYPKYAFTCRKCAPSFGYFGRFIQEKEITERADITYAGS